MAQKRKFLTGLTLIVVGFVVFCGWLVVESGLDCRFCGNDKGATGQPCILLQNTTGNEESGAANAPASRNERLEAAEAITFGVDHAPVKSVTLGSTNPRSGFTFQLELSSKGAAIRKATFSWKPKLGGFNNRDHKNPQPLVIISPVQERGGSEVLSMASKGFVFVQQQLQLPLDKLHWESFDVETAPDGSQAARFEATIKVQDTNEPVLKLIKTYKIIPHSYLLECNIAIENLSDVEREVRFNLAGPGGLGREGFRSDMRKFIVAFVDSKQEIYTKRLDIKRLKKPKLEYARARLDVLDPDWRWWRIWESPGTRKAKAQQTIQDTKREIDAMNLPSGNGSFNPIWIAATNKYFAAILRLVPDASESQPVWVKSNHVEYYDPDLDSVDGMSEKEVAAVLRQEPDGDETIGMDLGIASNALAAAGQDDSSRTYNFQLYIGPKDKSLFDKNERYRELGFVQTIDFMGCCCPAGIIKPLAFGILALMKWMYTFIGNYGVVIIILVFLMRLAMHPITKKSQVSMSKMTKLAPKAEEIKKKYANNKAEMNKQMMSLYKEQGASPIMGFLPMMVQMPIWIALWSAVYASIELRGAPFLPFWITDLSVPDALYRFPTAIVVPLLGWKIESLNLLPLMMGVAFYLQQKLMPSQAKASANPQVAQQQKMMMIMLPLMFPLMLYKAPSGVNLYIMASTFAGVFEQYVIRKHIREKEEAESEGLVAATSKTGGKVKKKKPKPFYKNM